MPVAEAKVLAPVLIGLDAGPVGGGALPCAALCAEYGTGAAAALRAAADPGTTIAAVVSRGGRPDLAGSALAAVRAPTLLLVGGRDHVGLQLNRHATREMPGETVLVVVPGATHLFAEPGALEKVAELACDWLVTRPAPEPAVDSGASR